MEENEHMEHQNLSGKVRRASVAPDKVRDFLIAPSAAASVEGSDVDVESFEEMPCVCGGADAETMEEQIEAEVAAEGWGSAGGVVTRRGGRPRTRGRAKAADVSEDELMEKAVEMYGDGCEAQLKVDWHPLLPLLEGKELPPVVAVDHEQMKYGFFWLDIGFATRFPSDTWPESAAIKVSFKDDVKSKVRCCRVYSYFPQREDRTFFKAEAEGAVGLAAGVEGLSFAVPLGVDGSIVPHASVEANAKVKFLFGPFGFAFRKSVVEAYGRLGSTVEWRFDCQSRIRGLNEFSTIVLLKVPEEAKWVTVDTELEVVPCKPSLVVWKDRLGPISVKDRLKIPLQQ